MHGVQTKGRTALNFQIRRNLAIAFFAVFLIDYVTKFLAFKYLGESPKKIFGNFLKLNLTINNGAAFNIGIGSGRFFAIFGTLVLAVIFYIGRRIDSKSWAVSLGILAGGIGGNLSDRIFRNPGYLQGGVIDWIQIPKWPIFNFADMAITLGFATCIWLTYKKIPMDSQRLKNG